ncbi:H-NS histone family protein [Cupriavidus pauculus]|uniref:H-NS histone family protein n=1 Tax=Cupriavidus pauculus TaxID=82633 RepID=UPI001EE16C05|nr:H-NS histone family protein [Cupriavidus pauculus]GJG96827.1 H-NS histone family protein [Cupriavidus pauculus]
MSFSIDRILLHKKLSQVLKLQPWWALTAWLTAMIQPGHGSLAPRMSRRSAMEAIDSEALIESDWSEVPIEAMPFEATTEAVAEIPVEVPAMDEPTETSAPDELTESAALVAPRYAQASEAAPEETRAPKRNRKPKTVAEVASPEVTTQKSPARKHGRKPKALIQTATLEASPEERRTPKRGQNPKILAEVASAEVTTQETPTWKGGAKQITLHGAEAAPEARTQNTQTRKTRQRQKVPTATQSPTRSTLLAQLASVNAQLERLRATEVPKIVEEIQQLMREYELSIEDIAGKPSDEPAGRAVPTKTKAAPRPKYRDPKTGQTWSGRGRAPAWIGKKPEGFLIDRLY